MLALVLYHSHVYILHSTKASVPFAIYMLLALLSPDSTPHSLHSSLMLSLLPSFSFPPLHFSLSLINPFFLLFSLSPLLLFTRHFSSLLWKVGELRKEIFNNQGHVLKCKQLTAFSKEAPLLLFVKTSTPLVNLTCHELCSLPKVILPL